MARIGFTSFDNQTPTAMTVPEILAAMTAQQKALVLLGFCEKVHPGNWRQWVQENNPTEVAADPTYNKVPRKAINTLYHAIDQIEESSRSLMRKEVVVTAAVPPDPDVEGDEGTPAVYNIIPATATILKNKIAADFVDIFTDAQVTAVLTKMVEYSRSGATGTWAYYKANVIL